MQNPFYGIDFLYTSVMFNFYFYFFFTHSKNKNNNFLSNKISFKKTLISSHLFVNVLARRIIYIHIICNLDMNLINIFISKFNPKNEIKLIHAYHW